LLDALCLRCYGAPRFGVYLYPEAVRGAQGVRNTVRGDNDQKTNEAVPCRDGLRYRVAVFRPRVPAGASGKPGTGLLAGRSGV